MDHRFKKYVLFKRENGKTVDINQEAIKYKDEAFLLFKELFNTDFGTINEDENLVSIHTGGWSHNAALTEDFKKTSWWHSYHQITASGGHYYFNTNMHGNKEWRVEGFLTQEQKIKP